MGEPKATIVVLTHNRVATLTRCLDRLDRLTEVDAEIIVVDNGSTDETADLLLGWQGGVAEIHARRRALIRPENEGVCARNHALRIARGEFILQVDDDVEVLKGWDTNLIRWFDDPTVGAAGQEGFYLRWDGLMSGPWKSPNFLDDRRPAAGSWCDLVMGYCWAWRNLRAIGVDEETARPLTPEIPVFEYDERFNPHWHEETDLQLQIKAAGYRIRCGPIVANHRSMKDWHAAHSEEGPTSLEHAAVHERLLIDKWGGQRQELAFELDRLAGA